MSQSKVPSAQEHNAVPRPGLESRPLDPASKHTNQMLGHRMSLNRPGLIINTIQYWQDTFGRR